MPDRRQIIFNEITDRVSDILYYQRKEDEELPVGAIEEAIAQGEITVDEIVNHFKAELEENLPKPIWKP